MIRWIAIAVMFGLLISGVLYDRIDLDPNVVEEAAEITLHSPVMEFPPPLAETWFCPVGSSAADSYAPGSIVITNIGTDDAVANLDLRTDTGPGATLRIDLAAGSTEIVDLASLGSHAAAAAVVEVVGGEGAVSHRIRTAVGETEGPCATTSAPEWHLAGGSTTRDTKQYIAILNPFANAVVFSATFQTATRTRQPGDLENAVVPARSVRIIDVGEYVAREAVVATSITTGDSGGQLVVERLQTFDGSLGPVGLALEAAVPVGDTVWYLPAGRLHDGADNLLSIYNPGELPASVDLELDPMNNADRATFGLVPVELTVAPGRLVSVDIDLLAEQIGLPVPYELGLTVVSVNGVPVIVDRWQLQPPIDRSLIGAGGSDGRRSPFARFQDGGENDGEIAEEELDEVDPLITFAQPTARQGVSTSHGNSVLSTRWVSPYTTLLPDNGTAVVVFAPEGALVEVRQLIGGSPGSPVRAAVEAGGRAVIVLDAPVAGAALIVTADQPIMAEVQLVSPERYDVIPLVPTLAEADR